MSVHFLLSLQVSVELRIILWLFPLKFIFALNVWLLFLLYKPKYKKITPTFFTFWQKKVYFIHDSMPLKARIYFSLNMEGFLKGILLISTISGILCKRNYSGSNFLKNGCKIYFIKIVLNFNTLYYADKKVSLYKVWRWILK